MRIVPVILCGGSGSRLWPLSRTLLPKQFLPLVSEHTMLQETVLRLQGIPGLDPAVIVSNEEHRFIAAEQMREIGLPPGLHLLEPAGRNTAPAVAAAALAATASGEDVLLLVLPSDHLVRDASGFRRLVSSGAALAAAGRMVLFGIRPDAPATGFGYIRRGEPLAGTAGAYEVGAFIEKPHAARAQSFLDAGGHYWNSGMFLFGARAYLAELGQFRPDIASACADAVAQGTRDMDFLRLGEAAFRACPSDSIDYAVMERTSHACVIEADIGWNDIGSWSSLWDVADKGEAGNVVQGDVYLDGARDNYVRAESRLVAAVGVSDLVIVETDDVVLVAHKDAAQDVKQAVEHLKRAERTEHFSHTRVYRPWGYYEALGSGERYQVKRLMLKPGAKISLQRHQRRAEHWVVVSGHARVVRGEQVLDLGPDESTYIPLGTVHRLENTGAGPLLVIEVQSGDYLGEDDIERFADDYRRS